MAGRQWSAAGILALLMLVCGVSACGERGAEVSSPPPTVPTVPVLPETTAGPATRLPDPYGSGDLVRRFDSSLDFRPRWAASAAEAPSGLDAFHLTSKPAVPDLDRSADRLARALHLAGPASTSDGHRSYGDRITHALVVDLESGLHWAYTRDGVRCTDVGPSDAGTLAGCAPVAAGDSISDWDPNAPRWSPVSPDLARRVAAPVFKAVGLDVAAATTTTGWGTTLVSVDPTIDGLDTIGLGTGVVVDKKGVLSASGWLGSVTREARYPVLDATAAVDRAKRPLPVGGCSTTAAQATEECAPEVPVGSPELGLVMWGGHDERLMVPAWIGRNADRHVLAVLPALESRYLPEWMYPPTATSTIRTSG